jgi:N-acyl-D-amino-acid deacylase
MYSLLIKNITVLDGSGKIPEILDVAVQNDKIVNIAKNISGPALSIIDGTEKCLSPGFIDIQNHSDSYWQIFDNPNFESLITQGITTILIGNCGASLAPLLSNQALLSLQKWHNLDGININWQSMDEFLFELSSKKFACNIATLVGYSTVRRGVVGDKTRPLDKGEVETIKKYVKQSLEEGAFGVSSGLSYSHEMMISELELAEIAKIVKSEKKLFSVHLRSEGSEIVEAFDEILDLIRTCEVNTKISHFKIRGKENWLKLPIILENMEEIYHKGGNLHFDVYPYDTIWQPLYAYLPKWASEGGRKTMLSNLSNPILRKKILTYLNNLDTKFPELIITSTANNINLNGKTLSQIAKNLNLSSEEAILSILENGGSEILVFDQNINSTQMHQLLDHPLSYIGTDGAGFNNLNKSRLVHPRCFGSMTKFLYLNIMKGAALEKLIQKITSGPAKKVGIDKRGEVKVGNFADLVLFDVKTIRDKSTYLDPYQYSDGIEYVFINGKAVISKSKITSQLPGYVLRKK